MMARLLAIKPPAFENNNNLTQMQSILYSLFSASVIACEDVLCVYSQSPSFCTISCRLQELNLHNFVRGFRRDYKRRSLYPRGFKIGCVFCLQVDGPFTGGLIAGGAFNWRAL